MRRSMAKVARNAVCVAALVAGVQSLEWSRSATTGIHESERAPMIPQRPMLAVASSLLVQDDLDSKRCIVEDNRAASRLPNSSSDTCQNPQLDRQENERNEKKCNWSSPILELPAQTGTTTPRPSTTWISQQLQDYRVLLTSFPVVTKSLTAGIVALVGDVLAQRIVEGKSSLAQLDLYRSLTVAAEGLFVSGPMLHFAYRYMDELKLPGIDDDSWMASLVQVFLDIVVMDTIFVGTFMITSAVLQGHTSRYIVHELRNEYPSTVWVSWLSSLSMAPIQFVNFRWIPVEFRVLITNLQDVAWNAAVSYMAHRSRQQH